MKVNNETLLLNICAGFLILTVLALITPQSLSAQQNILEDNEPISINTDLVTFNVSVTDREGRAVSGLKKQVFNVFDNKVLQDINFVSDEDAPASVSIVFDTSGSMNEKKIKQAKEALADFIKTSQIRDEFFLVDFNTRARLLLSRTRDSDAVLNKFTYLEPNGNTALFDAVYLGSEKVLQGAHPKKIVLIISDGEDNNSRFSFGDLRRRLQETGVVIYAIGFGGYFTPKGGMSGRAILDELASTTGGKAYFPNDSIELNEDFDRIAQEIRHFYSISYYPTDFTPDGKWHRLQVKLNFPLGSQHLTVRTRAGYYAGTN